MLAATHTFMPNDSLLFFLAVGSYFALQWLANLLVAATGLGLNCTSSTTTNTALRVVHLLASGGLSIVVTNLLCHRYLVEKARAMIKLYDSWIVLSSFTSAPFQSCGLYVLTVPPSRIFGTLQF
jgi:hypothetical protein